MNKRNNYYSAKITLDTGKPTILVVAQTWEEFRERAGAEYKREVGKDIDWEKSEFTLWWIYLNVGARKINISLHVPIIPFPTNFSTGLIEFDGYIKGKIVEK